MSTTMQAGLFFVGIGLGMALPSLPEPLSLLNPWLWVLFILIGIILIIKNN